MCVLWGLYNQKWIQVCVCVAHSWAGWNATRICIHYRLSAKQIIACIYVSAIHTHTQGKHNMLSMEMDALGNPNIIKEHAPIPPQKPHTLLIQHCADEDWSHRLAGVTVFYRCKVTCLWMNTKHAGVDLRLHSPLWLCMIIFTFSKQFLCPGTEPLTYSTLYLVLTLHIWKRDRQRRGRWKNIELKLQARTTKFKTKALCDYVCVCVPSVHKQWCRCCPFGRASSSLWKLWLDPGHRRWISHMLILMDFGEPNVHVWHGWAS